MLVWPFSHRITFTLLDQCADTQLRRHLISIFKPNPCKENGVFLDRPIANRNASFGYPKFVDFDTIKMFDYIKDDTIFIKVEIDNEEMISL